MHGQQAAPPCLTLSRSFAIHVVIIFGHVWMLLIGDVRSVGLEIMVAMMCRGVCCGAAALWSQSNLRQFLGLFRFVSGFFCFWLFCSASRSFFCFASLCMWPTSVTVMLVALILHAIGVILNVILYPNSGIIVDVGELELIGHSSSSGHVVAGGWEQATAIWVDKLLYESEGMQLRGPSGHLLTCVTSHIPLWNAET